MSDTLTIETRDERGTNILRIRGDMLLHEVQQERERWFDRISPASQQQFLHAGCLGISKDSAQSKVHRALARRFVRLWNTRNRANTTFLDVAHLSWELGRIAEKLWATGIIDKQLKALQAAAQKQADGHKKRVHTKRQHADKSIAEIQAYYLAADPAIRDTHRFASELANRFPATSQRARQRAIQPVRQRKNDM